MNAKAFAGFLVGSLLAAVMLLGMLALSWLTLFCMARDSDLYVLFAPMGWIAIAGFVLFCPSVLLGGIVGARLCTKDMNNV
jgi:hypothetical protein